MEITEHVDMSQAGDSDLAAIAALSTTSFGRNLLTLADAAAARTVLALGTAATHAHGDYDTAGAAAAAQGASQPLDSDLTAIAALSTTTFGRALLALADAAAVRAAIGAVSDTAYDATSWDGVTDIAPSKNAVRDKIQALSGASLLSATLGKAFRQPLVPKTRGVLILGNGTSGYNEQYVMPEQIIRDDDGTYYLTYTGTGPTGYGLCMATATSPSGPYTDIGLVRSNVDGGHLIRDGVTWYLFAGAQSASGIAVYSSTTGIHGTYNVIAEKVARGGAGTFDEGRCDEPHIVRKADGTFVMTYMGFNAALTREQIGMATAPNLTSGGTWTKVATTPIVANGAAGSIDEEVCADPFLVFFDGTWFLFYVAGPGNSIASSGLYRYALATSPDLATWTKRGLVFEPDVWPAADSSATWRGSFLIESDTIYFPYAGRKSAADIAAPKTQAYLATFDLASFLGGPKDNPWVRVENNSGDPRIDRTVGSWANAAVTSASGGNACSSATASDKITFYFEGRKVRWAGIVKSSYGQADVILDGVTVATNLSLYDATANGSPVILYESGDLAEGYHKLEIVAKGTHEASSSGNTVLVDYFEFISDTFKTPAGGALTDQAATVGSLRTLGDGAAQAAQGSKRARIIDEVHADAGAASLNTEQTLATLVLPAGLVAAGDVLIFEAFGDMLNNFGSSVNLTLRFKIGVTTVLATPALSQVTAATRHFWSLRVVCHLAATNAQRCKSTGAVTIPAAGATIPNASGNYNLDGYGTAAEDLAVGKNFIVTGQLGTADAAVDVILHAASLELVKK